MIYILFQPKQTFWALCEIGAWKGSFPSNRIVHPVYGLCLGMCHLRSGSRRLEWVCVRMSPHSFRFALGIILSYYFGNLACSTYWNPTPPPQDCSAMLHARQSVQHSSTPMYLRWHPEIYPPHPHDRRHAAPSLPHSLWADTSALASGNVFTTSI